MDVGTILSTLATIPTGLGAGMEGAQGPPEGGGLPAFSQLLALLAAYGSEPVMGEALANGTEQGPPNHGEGPMTEEDLEALLAGLIGQGEAGVRLDRPAEAGHPKGQEADAPPARHGGDDGTEIALLMALAAGAVILPPEDRPLLAPPGGLGQAYGLTGDWTPTGAAPAADRTLPGVGGGSEHAYGLSPDRPPAGTAPTGGLPQGRPPVQAVTQAAAWTGGEGTDGTTWETGRAVHVLIGDDAPPQGEAPALTAQDLVRTAEQPAVAGAPEARREDRFHALDAATLGANGLAIAADAAAGVNHAPGPTIPGVEGAAPAAEPGTPAAGMTETQHVLDQVVEAMEVLARDDGHEVRLHLRPPELGELHIRMDVHQDTVRLAVAAEHEHVTELLRSHLSGLREALIQRDIRVDQALVWTGTSADSPWSGRGGGQGQPGERPAYAAVPWAVRAAEAHQGQPHRRAGGEGLVDYRV